MFVESAPHAHAKSSRHNHRESDHLAEESSEEEQCAEADRPAPPVHFETDLRSEVNVAAQHDNSLHLPVSNVPQARQAEEVQISEPQTSSLANGGARSSSPIVFQQNKVESKLQVPTQTVNQVGKSENSTPDYSPSVLARRRRDNLHRRYQEAAKKSQEVFARLNATLSTQKPVEQPQSLTTTVAKRVPLILLPIGGALNEHSSEDPSSHMPGKFCSPKLHEEEITFSSIAAESTPLSETEKNNSAKESIDSPTVVSVKRAAQKETLQPIENNPVGILKYDEKLRINKARQEKKPSRRGEKLQESDDREERHRRRDPERNRASKYNGEDDYEHADRRLDDRNNNRNRKNRDYSSEGEESPSPDADDESYRRVNRRGEPGKGSSRQVLRSGSRASVVSAYDGYYDQRERRHGPDLRSRRRLDSRGASDFNGDRRSTYSDRAFYSRPRSTRDFDDESDASCLEDEYDEDYEYHHHQSRSRAGRQRTSRAAQPDPYAQMMATDPAWQNYLLNFYRHHGYYPTYEQLHRMWLDQQQTSILAQTGGQRLPSVTGSSSIVQKIEAADVIARSRTEQYVATQSRHLFDDEKASQLSVSISGLKETCQSQILDSDKSGDMLGSNVSGVEAFAIQVPHKHSVPHALARFSASGQLVLVSHGGEGARAQRAGAASVGSVELRSVRRLVRPGALAACDALVQAVDAFPGPLCAATSDQTALVEFCRRKAHGCRSDESLFDRQSATLLWHTVATLIRQNGHVTGPDLARLLLDDCPYEPGSKVIEVESEIAEQLNENTEHHHLVTDHRSRGSGCDRSLINTATQTIDRVEQYFRELLFVGCKKDALEWAIKHKLWGHALFLAMKMDQRTHTNVMIRFANSLPLTDPLQTLYQMMSGVSPSAVTRLSDGGEEGWSGWRAHLAIMLSNLSALNGRATDARSLERELGAVQALGDALLAQQRPHAAHFCRLACHALHGLDPFSTGSVLIGALQPSTDLKSFPIEPYHLTELYEYASSLRSFVPGGTPAYFPPLQSYKLHYALMLLDYGFAEPAFKYLAAVGACILQHPASFSTTFKTVVMALGQQLHQFDMGTIGPCGTVGMPLWIDQLRGALSQTQPIVPETQTVAREPSPERIFSQYKSQTLIQEPLKHQRTFSQHEESQMSAHESITKPAASEASSFWEPQSQRVISQHEEAPALAQELEPPIKPVFSFWQPEETQPVAQEPMPNYGFFSQNQEVPHQSELHSSSHVSPEAAGGSLNDSVFSTATPPTAALQPAAQRAPQLKPDPPRLDASKRNKSWLGEKLGGVVKKLLPKDTNAMILPDDSNKTILWDQKSGRWINTTGEAADEPPPPPPPSLAVSTASMAALVDSNSFQNSVAVAPQPAVVATTQQHITNLKAETRPTTTTTNRLAAYGKRYAIVSAFGVAPSATGPGPEPGAGGPPLATSPAVTVGAHLGYFVPAPATQAEADATDAFSAFSLPAPATAPVH